MRNCVSRLHDTVSTPQPFQKLHTGFAQAEDNVVDKLIGMKLLALFLPMLLASCITSPSAPAKPNELDAAGKTAFLEAINSKRDAAQSITCSASSGSFPPSQTYSQPSTRVIWNAKLEAAALNNASFLAVKEVNISSGDPHNDAGNGSVADRLLKANYTYMTAGETIASGQASASIVAQDWQDSTNGHCNLMLDPAMKDVGGALVTSTSGTRYWVMVIGKPQ